MENLVRSKNLRRLVLMPKSAPVKNAIKAILIAEMTTIPLRNAPTRPTVFYKLTKTGKMLKIKH